MKRLVRTLKKEKDFKTRCKIMACKMRKEGSTIQHICDFLGLLYSTVRDWLVLMRGRWLAARFSRHRRGRKRILDNAALKKLRARLDLGPKKCGFESRSRHRDLVAEMIECRLNITCSPRTLRRVLRKMALAGGEDALRSQI